MGVGLAVNVLIIYYQSLGVRLRRRASGRPAAASSQRTPAHARLNARLCMCHGRTRLRAGHHCHANKTNTILSWIMYASYFVLFAALYVKNYIFSKLATSPKRKKAE